MLESQSSPLCFGCDVDSVMCDGVAWLSILVFLSFLRVFWLGWVVPFKALEFPVDVFLVRDIEFSGMY